MQGLSIQSLIDNGQLVVVDVKHEDGQSALRSLIKTVTAAVSTPSSSQTCVIWDCVSVSPHLQPFQSRQMYRGKPASGFVTHLHYSSDIM